jgi:hypothetical protein
MQGSGAVHTCAAHPARQPLADDEAPPRVAQMVDAAIVDHWSLLKRGMRIVDANRSK